VSFGARAVHSTQTILTEHGLQYVLALGGLLLVACAGLVTLFERESDGSIRNFGDGLWWAVTTITTVGYGDKFPVTTEGRGIAIFLMLVGITLFGLITANIAAFLVKPASGEKAATLDAVLEQLRSLEAKLDQLHASERRDD
jgi:voltage-gated potassium channel